MNLSFKNLKVATVLALLCSILFLIAYCRGINAVRVWVENGTHAPISVQLTSISTGFQCEITSAELIAALSQAVQHPVRDTLMTDTNESHKTRGYYHGKAYFGPLNSASFSLILFSKSHKGFFVYPRKYNPFDDGGTLVIAQSESANSQELWSKLESDFEVK